MPRWVLRVLHAFGWLFLVVGFLGFLGHALEPDQAGTPELGRYGGWILDAMGVLLGVGALVLRKRLLASDDRLATTLDAAGDESPDLAIPEEHAGVAVTGPVPPSAAGGRDLSLASWVNRQANRLISRSDWGKYRPPARAALAFVCWLVGAVTVVGMGVLLDVPAAAWVVFSVAWSGWLALLLAGFALNSRCLLGAAIWTGLALPLIVLLVVVPLGVAFSE